MPDNPHYRSRDLGLEIGLLLARYLLDTENLHYGYWPEGLEVCIDNIPRAQEHYTKFLLSHVPEQAASVLDVGCGAGVVAEKLIERGKQVVAVAPESGLLESARHRLGERAEVIAALFQDYQPQHRFDLVLFSESFQYIPLDRALPHALGMLNPGGHVLICDFFKVRGMRNSPIGGGHRYHRLLEQIEALKLEVVRNIDITPFTAPNLDLVNDFLTRVGKPAYSMLMEHAAASRPGVTRFARWLFRKRIAKLERKYFSGLRTGETFAKFKTYRLLLVRCGTTSPSALFNSKGG